MKIFLSPPELAGSESRLLDEALASNWIAPLGPQVDAFEQEMAERVHMPHALATSSGTAALHLALAVAGVGAGDLVWTSTLTFAATANAVCYLGATPVFVDSDDRSWNMDPALFADALRGAARAGKLPRAVVAVDLYGQCADIDPIAAACREFDVVLIEDAAEALGAQYRDRPAGSLAELSILSFNGNKIITTSGGGMLLGRDLVRMERARFLATQAREATLHYEHRVVGYNYRLSNLLAAVGRAQLADLPRRVERRRAIRARYADALGSLPGWRFMPQADFGRSTFWLTTATVDPRMSPVSRDQIIERLAALEIESRPVWKPLHLQPVFADCARHRGEVAERLFRDGICLPSGSSLKDEDLDRIVAAIRAMS